MSPELHDALNKEEGQLFERKSSKIDPKGLADALLAFANADGGELVVGVTDNKTLEGFVAFPGKIDGIRSFIPTWVLPPIRYECKEISFVQASGETDCILVFSVEASALIHENRKGEVLVRRGKEAKRLDYHERKTLEQDKGLQRFESQLTDATIHDLNSQSVLEFGEKIGLGSADLQAILMARDLGEIKNGTFYLNYAGLLLFGKNPQKWIEKAQVRVLRFEGISEGTGTRLNLVKDYTVGGSILAQLHETDLLLKSQLRDFTKLDRKTGRFEAVPEYPIFAWFEAVVNAISHREYSAFGTDIQIKIFDNRLEIISPGSFPHIVRESNIKDIHFSRNPKIARVMCDMGYVREIGEGVNRIYQEMAAAGLPEPTFRGLDGAVLVKLENNFASRTLRKEHDLEQQIMPMIYNTLSEKERKVVLFVLENESITTSECAEVIQQSDDSALNLLKKLKNTSPPVLMDVRRMPQDPKAFYHLNPDILNSRKDEIGTSQPDRTLIKSKSEKVSNPEQETLFGFRQGNE